MSRVALLPINALHQAMEQHGYAFVQGGAMRQLLTGFGTLSDWPSFSASWNNLALDTYMGNGGRYRTRRHATYSVAAAGPIARKPHQPHYQNPDYNPLNGGIARWFEPPIVDQRGIERIREGKAPYTRAVRVVDRRHATDDVAAVDEQDEYVVDAVAMQAFGRAGCRSGTKHADDPRVLPGAVRRSRAVDRRVARRGASIPDRSATERAGPAHARVSHGVTPVDPLEPASPAYRDVLVVTFQKE